MTALGSYDAFVSYTHEQEELVAAMQRGIERFAKPWWRSRDMRLYRDRTTMAATADLWGTIVAAMQLSGRLVVVLSRAAAASEWVDREISWWLEAKSASDLILVLVDGELAWRDGGWAVPRCTALPPALRALTTEPRWIKLHGTRPGSADWTEKIAEVTAAIRRVDKDALYGIHRRESRRRVRHLSVAGVLGVMLLVVGLVASLIAGEKGKLALAGQLAARSTALLGTDLPQAQLLAVEAYRMAPNAETTSALFRAVTATPQALGYLDAGEEVTAVGRARSVDVVVAGTASGNVVRWANGARQVIGHTDGATRSVSVSDDGAVVSMTGAKALLWVTGRLSAVDLGDNRTAGPTAVTPSGRTVLFNAVSTLDSVDSAPPQGDIVTVDIPTSHYATFALPGRWAQLYAPADGAIVAAAENGAWWRRSGDGRADVGGSVYLGMHSRASAISPDGRYFTYSNGSRKVPVWDVVSGEADPDRPERSASVPGEDRQALAISPNGQRLAASVAGTVYVSDIAAGPAADGPAVALAGNSAVTALHFVDDSTLVGAAGHQVVTWDLTRTSRIGSDATAVDVPSPCNGCRSVSVVMRPDGQAVAVVADNSAGLVVRFDGPRPVAASFTADALKNYVGAVWLTDGSLLLPVADVNSTVDAELRSPVDGRLLGTWPVARNIKFGVLGVGTATDGTVYDVDGVGRVLVRNSRTGHVLRTLPAPSVTPAERRTIDGYAVSPEGARAAIVAGGVLRLEELDSGRSTLVTTGADHVAFAGASMIVRLADGRLEIRDASDGGLRHEIGGQPTAQYAGMPSSNGQLIAQVMMDGTVQLVDVGDGMEIGRLPLDTYLMRDKTGLAFSRDGATLVVATPNGGSGLGSVRRWSVSPARWLEAACTLAGRDLTPDEWIAAGGSRHPALHCRTKTDRFVWN